MTQFHVMGKPIELSERDFLVNLVRGVSFRILTLAQSLYDGQANGFPDISGTGHLQRSQETLREMAEISEQADDDQLRELFTSQGGKLQELIALDIEAVESIARAVGKTPLDRKKLFRYCRSKTFSEDFPSGAAWVHEPDYRALRRRSLAAFDAIWLLDGQIAGRVRESVESLGEVYEDVSAHLSPIARPVDQLRGAIEAIRQEIKRFGATLPETDANIMRTDTDDLLSDIDKDANSS